MADDERVTIRLRRPVRLGSEVIDELRFRAPKAKDLRGLDLDGGRIDSMLDLAARLSGQTTQAIDELCMEDVREVLELVGGFTGPGLPTGESS